MKYLILGNGDYARMLMRYINNTEGISIEAFTVEQTVLSDKIIDDKPVISSAEVKKMCNPSDYRVFMGIGYRNMNQVKQREFTRYKDMGFIFKNYIHPTAIIDNGVNFGEGNNIFEGVIIQEGVRIGNANLVYGGSLIAHESIIGDNNSFSVKSCVAGCSKIGNNCFVGANATIKDHIELADFTLVGAGAYVGKSTNVYDVVVPQKSTLLEGRKSLEFI